MSRFDLGRLRWRLLAANLAVAAAGVIAVVIGVWLAAPQAFERSMGMAGSGGMMGGSGAGMMDPLLRAAFGEAVGAALVLGFLAAVVVAVAVSLLLSSRLSRPIDELAAASRLVAGGDYAQRVSPASGELGDLAVSFNAMAASLEANEGRRRDLIGDVAHELRTPIASVRGYVEGLAAGVFEPGPAAWRVLDEQTARLEHLVDDLAVLWRAESDDLRLQIESLDGHGLLSDVHERYRAEAAERSIELNHKATGPGRILADRVRIAQVLDNLVGNAVRYTQPGGRVELGLAKDGRWTVLSVRDDGPGLDAEQASRVFERFYRADSSRSRDAGGNGLGLAITKSLVEAMGGTMEVASAGLGRGSTFSVRLPGG
ncbi:MAG TPA: ATP-binding protein [Candidatus Limnocylindrales bacterium]|jgi:histidine kinase